jgi:hypothetical protein
MSHLPGEGTAHSSVLPEGVGVESSPSGRTYEFPNGESLYVQAREDAHTVVWSGALSAVETFNRLTTLGIITDVQKVDIFEAGKDGWAETSLDALQAVNFDIKGVNNPNFLVGVTTAKGRWDWTKPGCATPGPNSIECCLVVDAIEPELVAATVQATATPLIAENIAALYADCYGLIEANKR